VELENILLGIDVDNTNVGMDLDKNVGETEDKDVDEEDEDEEVEFSSRLHNYLMSRQLTIFMIKVHLKIFQPPVLLGTTTSTLNTQNSMNIRHYT